MCLDSSRSRPIDPTLFRWPSVDPRLLGGRDPSNGEIVFPYNPSSDQACVELSRRGVLWSWTVQRFAPKAPPFRGGLGGDFVPFAVGIVELAEIRVQTLITGFGSHSLRIGMHMQLEIIPLFQDDDGIQVMTYAFQPFELLS